MTYVNTSLDDELEYLLRLETHWLYFDIVLSYAILESRLLSVKVTKFRLCYTDPIGRL